MVGFRDEHCSSHSIWKTSKMPLSLQKTTQCPKTSYKLIGLNLKPGGVNFQAGKESASDRIGKLIELDEVCLVLGDISSNLSYQPSTVRTVNF